MPLFLKLCQFRIASQPKNLHALSSAFLNHAFHEVTLNSKDTVPSKGTIPYAPPFPPKHTSFKTYLVQGQKAGLRPRHVAETPMSFPELSQERKRHINLRKILGTPAGCPWHTRRDKQGSTGRCPKEFLLFTFGKTDIFAGTLAEMSQEHPAVQEVFRNIVYVVPLVALKRCDL